MRRPVTACAALVVGLTVGTISSAQASVADASVEDFCQKAEEIANTAANGADDDALIDAARDLQKDYKKLAKLATTKKLRSAVKKIAKYYARVVASGDPSSKAGNYTDAEVKAAVTIGEFTGKNCAGLGGAPSP